MTVNAIINLIRPLTELDNLKLPLSAKVRWNMMRNLKACSEVAKQFDEQKLEVINRLSPDAGKIEPDHPSYPEAVKTMQEILDVETDTKLLKFPVADIMRDDLPIQASLILALEPLIEGSLE